jgi:hypothetical protein
MGRYPVLTYVSYGEDEDTAKKVATIELLEQSGNNLAGSFITNNEEQIYDAAGIAQTNGIVGLAASSDKIFTVVSPNGGNFGTANSGIALLMKKDKKLKPIDATNGDDAANKAFGIVVARADGGVDGQSPVSISINGGVIDGDMALGYDLGDMYWDSTLGRLFIGLTNVHKAENDDISGGIALLVGRFDATNNKKLLIETIVPAVNVVLNNVFDNDNLDYIFGFYSLANENDGIRADVYKVRTMHTSTGKSYALVNAGVGIGANHRNGIYALPLVRPASTGDGADQQYIGKVAQYDDLTTHASLAVHMTEAGELQAIVGAGSVPIQNTQSIEDMFVVGDSVFVCVAQERGAANNEAGIFRSTAIFNVDGSIRAWTQWQRVMGSVDKVFGAGMDLTFGNYWYLTTNQAGDKNTIKVTQWGTGSEDAGLMGNGLITTLAGVFTQENGGVHQVFNFDEKTPCIARTNPARETSIMVAAGYKKIAIIETGAGIPFTPTQDVFASGTNVFVKTDDALDTIGPICTCDVSRIKAADLGYLFVGGFGGVAVLRKTDGTGWDGRDDQGAVDWSETGVGGDDYAFKTLGSFLQVRKVLCDGLEGSRKLYIATVDSIYRIAIAETKFKDTDPDPLDPRRISKPDGYILDMLIISGVSGEVDTKLLVATTKGLFLSDYITDVDENKTPAWRNITLNSDANLLLPAAHLFFISSEKGGITKDGNLYLLAADLSLNLANVYRFNVQSSEVTAFNESNGNDDFYSIGALKTNFVTDGAIGFLQLSKHLDISHFLTRMTLLTNKTRIRNSEQVIGLDLDANAYNVGIMVQNSASGAWVVPGDWGIRVNE